MLFRAGAVCFFEAEDGIRDHCVTGVQTCALPISHERARAGVCRAHRDHFNRWPPDDPENPIGGPCAVHDKWMDGCVAMMRAAVESLLAAMAPCGQMDQRLMQWLRNAAALLLLVLLAGFLQTAAASSQHQQASATARKSSTDEPGIARFLR